ncbi:Periplasmic zinc-binding protein TroA precursor [Neorhodopirellula pilleata]|uniref:Periplasmic zinc-binding protein TroA n=2 Tax=Neorhodopirellula pilleata TaxID=2714738 RepID=A0A5C5ZPL4_9BACT|nr:Periplasmic zinc-binding protein TroA precursor [Neorhodopirellula pilleata]
MLALNRYLFGAICLATACAFGCQSSTPPQKTSATANGQLNVVATTAMVGDVVRGVGGEHVNVTVMLGPGIDPHLYKTSRDDVAMIMDADVVFYSGLLLEGKMTYTLDQVGKSKPVHAITRDLKSDQLLGDAHHPDPHVWFDVELWSRTADVVAAVLAESLPAHAAQFKANADAYQAELKPLADYANETLATIPESQRILITSHDAFGYLGRAYGIEVMGVQGISTDSEAGLRRVNELVDLLVEKKIPSVFVETSVSQKSIEALIEGAASRGHTVTIGGEMYSDAAGPAGTYEGTYEGMIDHNVTIIARALGGTAPQRGRSGKLNEE